MKVLRAVVSLLIGFGVSYSLAVTFFNYSDYSSPIDRLFLTCVPALAIGILLFEAFPAFSQWFIMFDYGIHLRIIFLAFH